MANPALTGIRVLDLSRVLAGPFACQLLGDLGAEVIKVENPGEGDPTRQYGPKFMKDAEGRSTESAVYLSANRNKKSVTIDMSKPEGQELVRALARKSDVVVENYKVGTLQRFGLDYKNLSATDPRLIYCSITGFGQSGPYRNRPGYDSVCQAMSGLMSLTGLPDGVPGGGPMKTGPSVIDILTALYADVAILSALYRRRDSGTGEHIDLALLDVSMAGLSHMAMQYLVSGEEQPRCGNEGFATMPTQTLQCGDGAVYLLTPTERQYRRFCAAIGRPDLAEDARFRNARLRSDNRALLTPILESVASGWSRSNFLEAMERADVPAGAVNNLAQAFDDPQVRHRGMAVSVPHPYSESLRLIANPIHSSGSALRPMTAPPLLGQHTVEVLRSILELPAAEVERLRSEGIV